ASIVPAPRVATGASQLLEGFESVRHGNAAVAHPARKLRELVLRHDCSHGSELQRARHVIVSIVTRSVDGHKQFSGTYRARINRHTGQPGQGVELCSRPRTQSASSLCNRPPHKFLKGLVLFQYPVQYLTARSVFNVLRAFPLREVRYWLPRLQGLERFCYCVKQVR